MEIKIPIVIDDKALEEALDKRIAKAKQDGDFVLVTRCKDCVFSRPLCHTEKKLYNDDCVGCTKISTSYHSVIMSENDFCSYAEPKEIEGREYESNF